jgi:hypothetical protein
VSDTDQGYTASAIDSQTHAIATGSGSAVNIVLGNEAIKPLMWFVGSIVSATVIFSVAALGISIYVATVLSDRSIALDYQAESLKTEVRLDAYWKQRLDLQLEKSGISVPAPRDEKTGHKK